MVQLGVQMDTDISNPIRMCTRIGCGYQYEFSLPNHVWLKNAYGDDKYHIRSVFKVALIAYHI